MMSLSKYLINGRFITGEEYQDPANNEKQFKFAMRNIVLNFSTRYPNTVTNSNGDVLVDIDKQTINSKLTPKWMVKYFEYVFD